MFRNGVSSSHDIASPEKRKRVVRVWCDGCLKKGLDPNVTHSVSPEMLPVPLSYSSILCLSLMLLIMAERANIRFSLKGSRICFSQEGAKCFWT